MASLVSTERELPYPIAVPWARASVIAASAASDEERFRALVELHEGVVRTLSLLAISAYVEHGPRRREIDDLLGVRLLGKPLSLGDWVDLLGAVLDPYKKDADTHSLPALVRLLLKPGAGRPSPSFETLARFVRHRNDWAHGKLPAEARERVLGEFGVELTRVVDELAFLRRYDLIVPLRVVPDGDRFRIVEAVACAHALTRTEEHAWADSAVEIGEDLLLVDRETRSVVLRLFPLVYPELGTPDDRDDLFVYERVRRSGAAHAVQRVHYVGVATHSPVSVDRRSSAAVILQAFERRLAPWLDGKVDDASEPIVDDAVFEPPSSRRGDVVGRGDELAGIDALTARAEGKVLLVRASPGAGKSALARACIERMKPAASHFVGPDGGRDDPRLIARSLLAQLVRCYRLRRAVPDDYGVALKALHDTMRDLSQGGERVIIVLDALDELRAGPNDAADLALLPAEIPAGVLFVVTSRPGPAADLVAARADVVVRELAPLSVDALENVAAAIAPQTSAATRAAAARAAEGNPLFLQLLLMGSGDTLPARVEQACARAIEQAVRSDGEAVESLIGLLAVARSGLTRRDLAGLLDRSPFQIGRVLRAVLPLLTLQGDRYVLFHSRVRDWAKDELCTKSTRVAHASAIADLLRGALAVDREDALLDLPHHLEAAGRGEEALTLLDGDFLPRRARATASFESAREELVRGVRLSGSDVITASRHALTAALVTRGATLLVRAGLCARIAAEDDPRVAAGLARSVAEPEERRRAVADVARAIAPRDRAFARVLLDDIDDDALRSETALAIEDAAVGPPPGDALAPLRDEIARILGEADRLLRVRGLVAAAAALPLEAAADLAQEAMAEAKAERSDTLRSALVLLALVPLVNVDREKALRVARALPSPLERVRALVVASDLMGALEEAQSIDDTVTHETAIGHVLARLAAREPVLAHEMAAKLSAGPLRDRVYLAIVESEDPASAALAPGAAAAIGDATLRAGALARLLDWGAAEATAAALSRAEQAAAYERMAAAVPADDTARRERYRGLASAARASLEPSARAASLREQAALAGGTDSAHADAALEHAQSLDASYDGRRRTLLRRARLLLDRPSLAAVSEAMRLAASYGDAFADLHADVIGTIATSMGDVDLVKRALSGLQWAERLAGAILAGDPALAIVAPARADAAERARLEAAKWLPGVVSSDAYVGEAELLERRLEVGNLDERDVDRLVRLHLAAGDRASAGRVREAWTRIAPAVSFAHPAAPAPAPSAPAKESSVLFSLKGMMDLEEAREAALSEESIEGARLEASEGARLDALREATIERAKYEASSTARLEVMAKQQAHELKSLP